MTIATVVVDYKKFSIPDKIDFYNNVLGNLVGNPIYPTPDISLDEAQLSLDNLIAAAFAAHDGSHLNISLMHDAEAVADKNFTILAAYVERIADGDVSKILSSSFHESHQRAIYLKPVLAIKYGAHSGSIIFFAKAVDKSGAYIWQLYEGDLPPLADAEWVTIGHSTSASFQVEGLTKAKIYQFRFAAITTNGTTDFSAPVSILIV